MNPSPINLLEKLEELIRSIQLQVYYTPAPVAALIYSVMVKLCGFSVCCLHQAEPFKTCMNILIGNITQAFFTSFYQELKGGSMLKFLLDPLLKHLYEGSVLVSRLKNIIDPSYPVHVFDPLVSLCCIICYLISLKEKIEAIFSSGLQGASC
jgi:hypothetical protein